MNHIHQHKVASHFDSASQEFESAKLGMWLFIVQEILFFSALFVAYTVFRYLHPKMFIEAAAHLSWVLGSVNTLVLLFSSFTMAMAIRSAMVGRKEATRLFLIITFLCACFFMGIKCIEYIEKISHGYVPSKWFSGYGTEETLHLFFGIYFCLTGLHAIHVFVGMGLIIWLYIKNERNHFSPNYYTPLEIVGLYWHLVDIIWIFLFPLLYLI